MCKRFAVLAGFAILSFFSSLSAFSQPDGSGNPPDVLASIHPLGLIAASVVPAANLDILLQPGVTPHDFSLRPSDIDRLQEADVIFWAGPAMEPYLSGFARRWPDKHWIDISSFAYAADVKDPHYWLSAPVALAAQAKLAEIMGVDSDRFQTEVQQALAYSDAMLAPVRERGFFVFHRAYDHWVTERGLNQVGSFTLTPEQKPGMRTIQLMRQQLRDGEVTCVFREPEYSPALVVKVVGDLPVKQGELDPLGSHIALARDGYPYFLRDLADRAVNCLK